MLLLFAFFQGPGTTSLWGFLVWVGWNLENFFIDGALDSFLEEVQSAPGVEFGFVFVYLLKSRAERELVQSNLLSHLREIQQFFVDVFRGDHELLLSVLLRVASHLLLILFLLQEGELLVSPLDESVDDREVRVEKLPDCHRIELLANELARKPGLAGDVVFALRQFIPNDLIGADFEFLLQAFLLEDPFIVASLHEQIHQTHQFGEMNVLVEQGGKRIRHQLSAEPQVHFDLVVEGVKEGSIVRIAYRTGEAIMTLLQELELNFDLHLHLNQGRFHFELVDLLGKNIAGVGGS